nr:hypothetical protein GCM10020092_032040 [Actinoplanes digitatis]
MTLASRFERSRKLAVSHAFHSALMDPMLAEFAEVVRGLACHEPAIAMVSTVTGAPVEPGLITDPEYWVRHVRETVRFADGVAAMGADAVVEVGPDSVLSALIDAELVVPTLRRDREEDVALLGAVAALWTAGVELDLGGWFPGARRVPLPTYAFDHRRYWPEPRERPPRRDGRRVLGHRRERRPAHPRRRHGRRHRRPRPGAARSRHLAPPPARPVPARHAALPRGLAAARSAAPPDPPPAPGSSWATPPTSPPRWAEPA